MYKRQLTQGQWARLTDGDWPSKRYGNEHLLVKHRPVNNVALAVARALNAPLDLLLVRKIGAPWQSELAVAAVVDGTPPELVLDETMQALAGVDQNYIEAQRREALQELQRRRAVYLQGREPLDLEGATVVVVDDGIATGTPPRGKASTTIGACSARRRTRSASARPADARSAKRALNGHPRGTGATRTSPPQAQRRWRARRVH